MKHLKVGNPNDLLDALNDNPYERIFNPDKKYTRMQAERALSVGVDPSKFTDHANYHVRRKAWEKMGRPLPDSTEEQNKFLATLQGTQPPKDSAALPGFYALVRQRILKEVPVKEPVQTEEAQTEETPKEQ